jgi:acetyltransferase
LSVFMATSHTSVTVSRLDESQARAQLAELMALLADAVDHGASIGFLRPLPLEVARAYWEEILVSVGKGTRILLAAGARSRLAGTVQLDLCMKPNGIHRAEVQKLMVLHSFRRQGIATLLMRAVEAAARTANRSLLVLDTEAGSGAEHFYDVAQWVRVGSIPDFALSADGIPTPNIIYCKHLVQKDPAKRS